LQRESWHRGGLLFVAFWASAMALIGLGLFDFRYPI
jgi:hypothetical protein